MRTLTTSRATIATLAGLTLVGALAGCAATAEPTAAPSEEPTTESTPDTTTPTESTGAYTDGTYTESGSYQSPDGTETLDVTVTLEGDVVTELTVVGHGDNPDSQHYQGEFIGGINSEVVGKSIDDISVSKVAGSSLSSGGFMTAVAAIKADAAA